MYQFSDPLITVKGIGENLQKKFSQKEIEEILDLLLRLPLRYEDRSQILAIDKLQQVANSYVVGAEAKKGKEFFTIKGKFQDFRQYYKGRLLISRANITDKTGEVKAIWFNNKFLKNKVNSDDEFFVSGEFKDGTILQASVEKVKAENLHTARLVPIYSKISTIKQGNLRNILKRILDDLTPIADQLEENKNIADYFKNLHFPDKKEDIVLARERLALEEIIYLIHKSKEIKKTWQENNRAPIIKIDEEIIPQSIPFKLTTAQERSIKEILNDLEKSEAMNRLLVGDVGSGKTVVAGIAAWHSLKNQKNVALVAPTQILAKQHFNKLQELFPDISIQLILAGNSKQFKLNEKSTLYVGTHAVINRLEKIDPALIVYDEQHRFGVSQRQTQNAHILTMTATPIPRSLMLSIFSHLELSLIDEMPKNRQIATTWLVPQRKEKDSIEWLVKELLTDKKRQKQALIVCPFIDPSSYQALENVAAANDSFTQLEKQLDEIYLKLKIPEEEKLKIGLLHSRLAKKKQSANIEAMFANEIQILVTTPMVEVGVDLPNANIIIIQAAERFGLASLHQLRGRVGRQGQASYCLLFTSQSGERLEKASEGQQRLLQFCEEKDGLKLAQMDLEHRGAGDIFGLKQSGFDKLRFASWTNAELIKNAKEISEKKPNYQSFLARVFEKNPQKSVAQN